jgi:hypothetical protein
MAEMRFAAEFQFGSNSFGGVAPAKKFQGQAELEVPGPFARGGVEDYSEVSL